MAICEAGDLWLVCNAQDLVRFCKLAQLYADRFADASADSGVDLVEHNRARELGRVRNCFQHQHQSRRLAARCDTGERLEILTRVRREIKLNVIDTFWAG